MNELAIFASRFGLGPDVAYVLPTLFEVAARKTGRSFRALVAEATYNNFALGEYMAQTAKEVAAKS